MKQKNNDRMKLAVIVIVAVIILGIGRAEADFTFGEVTNLGPTVNSARTDGPGAVSPDGLELYIGSGRSPDTDNNNGIWLSTRRTVEDSWGVPVRLPAPLNTSKNDWAECMSADGMELYGESGFNEGDIWVATRATKDEPWSNLTYLPSPINSSSADWIGSISADGLELYLSSTRPGGYGDHDLYVSKRKTVNDAWDSPVNLGPLVNSSDWDYNPLILPDGLTLYFGSWRAGGYGEADIWVTKRATREDQWGVPVNLGSDINTNAYDDIPKLSYDASLLYICSSRSGGFGGTYGDVWQIPIVPIVDLNGDGIIDAGDMCIMVDHWGEDYSLCDIGPTPFGDGVVDVQDLIVLAEYLFEELPGRPIQP